MSPAAPAVTQPVGFSGASTGNPKSWSRNFGDGGTSTAKSPSHVFGTADAYSVSLKVANISGSSSTSSTKSGINNGMGTAMLLN